MKRCMHNETLSVRMQTRRGAHKDKISGDWKLFSQIFILLVMRGGGKKNAFIYTHKSLQLFSRVLASLFCVIRVSMAVFIEMQP